MKKLLAILLAMLTVFSFCSLAAAAEDASEPASETEPATFNTYDISQDPDFVELQYMSAGNDKATILKPGDKITTYVTKMGIDVLYYPDSDALFQGAWKPADTDTNNLAFSLSAKEFFSESFTKEDGAATIRDLDYTDFTIPYSDENKFVGWAVYSYESSTNTIKLCGVWEKNRKIKVNEKVDDVYYIMDFFFSIRKAAHKNITLPLMKVIRTINNAILYVKTWLYKLIFHETVV